MFYGIIFFKVKSALVPSKRKNNRTGALHYKLSDVYVKVLLLSVTEICDWIGERSF
jgi:hypothetical protein